jgi:hypothetical protein
MNFKPAIRPAVVTSFLITAILITGCGGGTRSPAALTKPALTPIDIRGQWQFITQSAVKAGRIVIIEANLAQTVADVLADKSNVVVIQGTGGVSGIAFSGFGGECDSGALESDEVQATISNQTQLSFTMIDAGSLGTGSSSGTATISSDGTQITNGTYTTAAACGFDADNGAVIGTSIKPFAGTYSGILTDGATTDALIATVTQTGFDVNLVGTDNAAPFTLGGKAVGATFDVTGTIAGRAVEYVGIYELSTNDFRVYDTNFNFQGVLQAGTITFPISVTVAPTSTSVQVGNTRKFTAMVSQDLQNKGVTWALSGAGCSGTACGTLSSNSSPSGVGIIYTAPNSVPNPSMVTITATSVQDTTKNGTGTVIVTTTPQVIELGLGQSPNLIVDFNGKVDLSWLQVGALGNVIFAQSTDRGNTFVPKTVTTPAPISSLAMAVDGQGDINLLWQDGSGGALFGNSMDGGVTFLQTDVSSLIPNVGSPQLTVTSSGIIDVSQITRFPGMGQGVFSTIITNRGAGSKPHVEIASNFKDVDFDGVAASGAQSQIYVSWQMQSETLPECDIMFSRSLDGGTTFSTPLNVSNNPAECAEFPQLFADSTGAVDLVWTTPPGFQDNNGPLVNPNEVYFARSTDQGTTFSTPVALVGINQFSGVGDPRIAVEPSGTIDVVFDANTPTDTIALFARSTDGGTSFSPPVTVATGGANSPTIAIDSCGGTNVTWAGGSDVFFSRSSDGMTFSPPTNLSNAQKSEFSPLIATDAKGLAYIVWEDATDVFFRLVRVCQ